MLTINRFCYSVFEFKFFHFWVCKIFTKW